MKNPLLATVTSALLVFGVGCAGSARYSATATVDTPQLIMIEPDVQVVADYHEPVFYSDNYYWRYDNGVWYRSNNHVRGWVRYEAVPARIRRIERPTAYIRYRGEARGTATVRDHRDHRDHQPPPPPVQQPGAVYNPPPPQPGATYNPPPPARNPPPAVHNPNPGPVYNPPPPAQNPRADRKEVREDFKDARKEAKQDAKDVRQDAKEERKEAKAEAKADRKDDRQDAKEERKEAKQDMKDAKKRNK